MQCGNILLNSMLFRKVSPLTQRGDRAMEFQGSVSFFDYISDGYYISSTILPMFSAFKAKDECTYRFEVTFTLA